MTIDFVRPMGVPPVREPRPVNSKQAQPQIAQDQSTDDRLVGKDPVRGNVLDVRG